LGEELVLNKGVGEMPKRYGPWGLIALLGIILIILPQVLSRYMVFVLYTTWLSISLAQSWNLLAGYAGLISLGHAAFFGLGAYTTAMMVAHLGIPFLFGAIGGGLVAAAFSVVVAIPVFRFRGIYFAIGTLVLAEALRIWMINWDFTGGAQGIHLAPGTGTSLAGFYYIMLCIAAGTTILLVIILRTKLGMGLRAIGGNEDSAQNMGVNTFRTKLRAFLISAFIAGFIGGIHATKMASIEPYSIFAAMWSLSTVNTVIIGGIGTVLGPVVGSIFVVFLAELLADYHTFHLVITGIILILVIRLIPAGIWGQIRTTHLAKRVTGGLTT
jgi:branched-chain amino acid transport system permease protein